MIVNERQARPKYVMRVFIHIYINLQNMMLIIVTGPVTREPHPEELDAGDF